MGAVGAHSSVYKSHLLDEHAIKPYGPNFQGGHSMYTESSSKKSSALTLKRSYHFYLYRKKELSKLGLFSFHLSPLGVDSGLS